MKPRSDRYKEAVARNVFRMKRRVKDDLSLKFNTFREARDKLGIRKDDNEYDILISQLVK